MNAKDPYKAQAKYINRLLETGWTRLTMLIPEELKADMLKHKAKLIKQWRKTHSTRLDSTNTDTI